MDMGLILGDPQGKSMRALLERTRQRSIQQRIMEARAAHAEGRSIDAIEKFREAESMRVRLLFPWPSKTKGGKRGLRSGNARRGGDRERQTRRERPRTAPPSRKRLPRQHVRQRLPTADKNRPNFFVSGNDGEEEQSPGGAARYERKRHTTKSRRRRKARFDLRGGTHHAQRRTAKSTGPLEIVNDGIGARRIRTRIPSRRSLGKAEGGDDLTQPVMKVTIKLTGWEVEGEEAETETETEAKGQEKFTQV